MKRLRKEWLEGGNELSPTNNCHLLTKSRNETKKITLYVPYATSFEKIKETNQSPNIFVMMLPANISYIARTNAS